MCTHLCGACSLVSSIADAGWRGASGPIWHQCIKPTHCAGIAAALLMVPLPALGSAAAALLMVSLPAELP